MILRQSHPEKPRIKRFLQIMFAFPFNRAVCLIFTLFLSQTAFADPIADSNRATVDGVEHTPSISGSTSESSSTLQPSPSHLLPINPGDPGGPPPRGGTSVPSDLCRPHVDTTVGQEKPGRPFEMISVGDSIVWGQALPENQKMYTLTQQWLSLKLNRPVHNRVYAHSGATVRQPNPTGDVVKWPGEVPAGYPWISTQIECASSESQQIAPIDFVLLDGCINDITARTIVGEEHSREFLSTKIREYCHDAFLNILKDTLSRFPSAYIVVLGYFQIVSSRQSDVIQAVISYLGGHPIDPRSPEQFAEQTAMWERHSTEELKRAVNEVNYNVSRNGQHYRRAIFVSPNFTDENAYGGTDPLLATRTDPDPFAGQRDGWCSFHDHQPLINALTAYSCRHPNLFHPNRRGAERYTDAIKNGLAELLRNV